MILWFSNTLLVIGLVFILLSAYSLIKYKNRMSAIFILLCLSMAIYTIGYGFELRSESIDQIFFFKKLEYFGVPFIPAFWLLFAYKFYFNKNSKISLNIAVMTIPLITLFLSSTNELHHMLFQNVTLIFHKGYFITYLTKGPWYYINMIYAYIALFIGMLAFLRAWSRSLYTMRTQAFLMFVGSLCPVVINAVYLLGVSLYGINLEPFGLLGLSICYFIALFHYDYLDLKEITRSMAFSEISEGIIVIDERGRLVDYNSVAQNIFEFLDKKYIGKHISEFPKAAGIFKPSDNPYEFEVEHKKGIKYYECRMSNLKNKKRKVGTVYFIHDISKQKEMIQALDDMASYDSLTQVYNRRKFMLEAEKETRRIKKLQKEFSVLMIDIDYFKNINDEYGHLAGDEAIKSVINICKKNIRNTDILGRFGGEEFVIILSEIEKEKANMIADRIRKQVEDLKVMFYDKEIRITISIGVASYDSKCETNILKIIRDADVALYKAKSLGRNQVSNAILIEDLNSFIF